MKDKNTKFVVTTFEETANQLKEAGFVLVSHSGNIWTFLNQYTSLQFEKSKVAYTDRLNI